jgi:alcohol dehydrogenase class IV
MSSVPARFEQEYHGCDVLYGRGRSRELGEYLERKGTERAMIVCGSNVGANDALMDPIREGLGDRLVGTFDETTPQKSAETVYDGIARMRELDPDVLIGVGGGSSIDVARQMSVFAADGRSLETFRDAVREGETPEVRPGDDLTEVLVLPTTFAGADMNDIGSIEIFSTEESPTGDPVRLTGGIMPMTMVYDPDAFETTPSGPLLGSVMNGFDKGIETLYARDADPVTDATAIHGLRLFRDSVAGLADGDPAAMEAAVAALVLVQYDCKISLVHAVGHGFQHRYPVHQGLVHAAVVPHVLEYLFEETDVRLELLAAGLGITANERSDDELAAAIVEDVTAVRDAIGMPSRLREIEGITEDGLPDVAEYLLTDKLVQRVPDEVDPTAAEMEALLREAW